MPREPLRAAARTKETHLQWKCETNSASDDGDAVNGSSCGCGSCVCGSSFCPLNHFCPSPHFSLSHSAKDSLSSPHFFLSHSVSDFLFSPHTDVNHSDAQLAPLCQFPSAPHYTSHHSPSPTQEAWPPFRETPPPNPPRRRRSTADRASRSRRSATRCGSAGTAARWSG